jgi:hypothetical protein
MNEVQALIAQECRIQDAWNKLQSVPSYCEQQAAQFAKPLLLMDIDTLPNTTEEQKSILFDYWWRSVIAVDREHGLEMHRSRARRRAGRPAHYYVFQVKPYDKVFGLSAFSDAEAITKANKRLGGV